MRNFTILDGVIIAVISILVVFIVLIGLQIIMNILRILIEKQRIQRNIRPLEQSRTSQMDINLEEDEESKTVAALTALILANQDQQDKQYHITSIKRVR